ncbi:MAG: DUF2103 domain-containing protein [Methanosarcinales archaeon]|nr:DUF2103 domain-containing protein [Methanosarcinales archaeon]
MTQTKLGGAHTTIVGGRTGKKAAEIVARHPMVKRIIPSVISVKEAAGGKTTAKVLRSDAMGNLHLLISSGTSAQELRIITTVGDFPAGESLRCELNEMLSEAMGW